MNMSTRTIAWAPLSASTSRAKPSEVRLSIHAARTDTHGSNAAPRLDIAISNDIAESLGLYTPGSSEARHAAVYCADDMLLVCRREDGLRLTGQTPQAVYKVGGRSSRSPNSARCFATALPSFCITEPRRATTAEHRIDDGALIIQVPKDFLLTSVAPVALAPGPVPQPAMEERQPADRLPLPFDSTRIPDAPGLITLDLETESAPPPARPRGPSGTSRPARRGDVPALETGGKDFGANGGTPNEPAVVNPVTSGATAPAAPEPTVHDPLVNDPGVSDQPETAPAPTLSAAASRILKVLTVCAAAGKPCPANRELSDRADCTEQDATNLMAALERAGFIHRTFVDRAGMIHPVFAKGRGRIVEIVSTGQATANPFAVPSSPPEKPTGGGASAPKPMSEPPVEDKPTRPATTTTTTADPSRRAKPAPVSLPRGRSGHLSDAEREALEIVRSTAATSKGTAVHGQPVIDAAITWLRSVRHVVRLDGAGGYRIDEKPKTGDELVEFANQRRAARGLPPYAVAGTAGRAA